MFSLTSGTICYEIPLPSPYKLKQGFPLIIREGNDWLIECPAFDEYGYGQTYLEALTDLGGSLIDFWQSLKTLVKQNKKLGAELQNILDSLNENIEHD